MKERPILFSAPMVRAILSGAKTQTRRVFKLPRGCSWFAAHGGESAGMVQDDEGPAWWHVDEQRCPYGQPGDRLWVRETFGDCTPGADAVVGTKWDKPWYRADADDYGLLGHDGEGPVYVEDVLWRPSIHMPRWASRILLEITDVRVERLQDISQKDAIAEGIESVDPGVWRDYEFPEPCVDGYATPRKSYRSLWEHINGAGSWAASPWVWVLTFRRVEG